MKRLAVIGATVAAGVVALKWIDFLLDQLGQDVFHESDR